MTYNLRLLPGRGSLNPTFNLAVVDCVQGVFIFTHRDTMTGPGDVKRLFISLTIA